MSGIPAGAGQLLGKRLGKFEILALLALGGTAEIYLARIGGAAGFEKYVVVKCLHDHLADDAEFVKMFLDEARLAAHLDHSNIVQTMELGQHEGRYYMVMEFLAGLSLAMIVRRAAERLPSGRIPVPLVLNILAQSCAGLHYAHEKAMNGKPLNIVHRDISPQNLVISFEGVVKVVDFGIAKAEMRETRTRSGTIKGKFAYMSPEQCVANNVDRRTDVFALGVIGHELLTGRRLFKRPSPYETYQAVIECDVKPPSEIDAALEPALDRVIMAALTKDKDARYPTAEAFGDALLGYLHHRGIGSGPGDVSRFFDAFFGQELDEHSGRMRELISGRDLSVDTGASWGGDDDVDLAAASSGSLRVTGEHEARRPSAGSLSNVIDDLGVGSRVEDDDEMPAERTRIESNPLERVNELHRAMSEAQPATPAPPTPPTRAPTATPAPPSRAPTASPAPVRAQTASGAPTRAQTPTAPAPVGPVGSAPPRPPDARPVPRFTKEGRLAPSVPVPAPPPGSAPAEAPTVLPIGGPAAAPTLVPTSLPMGGPGTAVPTSLPMGGPVASPPPPGASQSGRFPDLANLPTMIAAETAMPPVSDTFQQPTNLAPGNASHLPNVPSGLIGAPMDAPRTSDVFGNVSPPPPDASEFDHVATTVAPPAQHAFANAPTSIAPLPMDGLRPPSPPPVMDPLAGGYPVMNAQLSAQIATGATVFPSAPGGTSPPPLASALGTEPNGGPRSHGPLGSAAPLPASGAHAPHGPPPYPTNGEPPQPPANGDPPYPQHSGAAHPSASGGHQQPGVPQSGGHQQQGHPQHSGGHPQQSGGHPQQSGGHQQPGGPHGYPNDPQSGGHQQPGGPHGYPGDPQSGGHQQPGGPHGYPGDPQRAANLMSPVGQHYPEQVDWAAAAAQRVRAAPPWLLAILFLTAIGIALALTVLVARALR